MDKLGVVISEYARKRRCLADVDLPTGQVCAVEFVSHSPSQVRCPVCQNVRMQRKQRVNLQKTKQRQKQAREQYRLQHPGGLTQAQIEARTGARIRIHR